MANQYVDNPINQAAWLSFVEWAAKQPEIVRQFEAETKLELGAWVPPKNALEAMIDKATGHRPAQPTEQTMRAFVHWVTEHHWGLDYAPTSVVRDIEAQKKLKLAP